MSRLILTTSMTADAVIDVDEWYVSEGGDDPRPFGGERVRMRLVDSTTFDSGVVLLRYEPTRPSV